MYNTNRTDKNMVPTPRQSSAGLTKTGIKIGMLGTSIAESGPLMFGQYRSEIPGKQPLSNENNADTGKTRKRR